MRNHIISVNHWPASLHSSDWIVFRILHPHTLAAIVAGSDRSFQFYWPWMAAFNGDVHNWESLLLCRNCYTVLYFLLVSDADCWGGWTDEHYIQAFAYTQKNKCWIYVYFTHWFNAQTNYLLHAMCKITLDIHRNSCQVIQQLDIDISTWCNVAFFWVYQWEYAYLPEVNAFFIETFMFLNLGYSLPFRGLIDHQSGWKRIIWFAMPIE